jgi:hypothetical protein
MNKKRQEETYRQDLIIAASIVLVMLVITYLII